MYVSRLDGEPLAVAGLWSAWRDPADADKDLWQHSAAVITTAANATMEPVHDRMPVIVPQSAWSQWLDPDNHDTAALTRLLVPAPDDLLRVHPVSLDVNSVGNNGSELIEPALTTDVGS
jgi:putative SOS response-associated peptidase YedK